jgi:hypothetical protein
METTANASTAPAPTNVSNSVDTGPVPPTGNTSVESNITGM